MQIKLDKWNIAIGDGVPLVVMAGLNVLEDEALALEVCAELKSICADLGLPYIFKADGNYTQMELDRHSSGVGAILGPLLGKLLMGGSGGLANKLVSHGTMKVAEGLLKNFLR